MQQLAGIITESQLNETSTPKYSVKSSKKGFSVIKTSTGDEITSFDNEEKAKQHAEKLNKMKIIPKEKFKEGFQGDDNEGDGLSGFRGGSSRIPATHSMSPIQQREALIKAWDKVPLGIRMNQGGMPREIPKELLKVLDNMGYAICHK